MSDNTDHSHPSMSRRQAMNRLAGTSLGIVGSWNILNSSVGKVRADPQPSGNATFYSSGTSVTGKRHHLVTKLENTTSFYDNGQYVHRFYCVGDAVSTEQNDKSVKVDDISAHVWNIDASSSGADVFATEDDDETLAYPKPTGGDLGSENPADDIVLATASVLNNHVAVAVAGSDILNSIFNSVTGTSSGTDSYEFLWNWGNDQSDACHHIYFYADHGANENGASFTMKSKSSTALNEMYVTLGEEPNVYSSSVGDGNTPKNPPTPEDVRTLPGPEEMTQSQRDKYGVRKISNSTFKEHFPNRNTESTEPKYEVMNYPIRIWDVGDSKIA